MKRFAPVPATIVVMVLIALLLPAGTAAAQQVKAPMAERVPADALLYVGWSGSEAAAGQFEGTHARALLEASNLPALFERTLPALGKAIAQKHPEARPWNKFFGEIAPILYRHPTAIAFGGVDWETGGDPLPRLLVVCDAGADAPVLRTKLSELFQMVRKLELMTLVDVQDGVLYMSLGWQKLDLAMAREDASRSLAADRRFVGAMEGLIEAPAQALFLDMKALMVLAEEGARRDKGDQGAQEFRTFIDATGLRGLGNIAATGGFVEELYHTAAFVEARTPRTGLLDLLEGEPIDEAILAAIPADAALVAAGRLDLAKLLTALRNSVQVANPNAVGDLEQGLKFINMIVGADIENDLLKATGPSWAAYTAPGTGDTLLGLVAINKPDEPKRVEAAMTNLSMSLASLVNENLRQQDKPFRLVAREAETPEGKVHYLDLPAVAPAWGMSGDLLYFGLYPQNVASARVEGAGERGFLGSEGYALVKQLAGEKPISAFQYVDLPRYSGRAYTILNAWAQLGSGTIAGFGETAGLQAQAPPMLLPPYATFRKHVTPAVAVSWVDDRGLHWRSAEPFPGSAVLGIGMQ